MQACARARVHVCVRVCVMKELSCTGIRWLTWKPCTPHPENRENKGGMRNYTSAITEKPGAQRVNCIQQLYTAPPRRQPSAT
jgi:hypothetical protein